MEISRRNKLKKSVEKTIITLSFMAIVLGGGGIGVTPTDLQMN